MTCESCELQATAGEASAFLALPLCLHVDKRGVSALRAFARLKVEGVNGVLLFADPSNDAYAGKIAELAQQYRLPRAFQLRNNVAAGGLMSYGCLLMAQSGHPR